MNSKRRHIGFPTAHTCEQFLIFVVGKKIIPWNVGRKKEEQFLKGELQEEVYDKNFWRFFSPHIAWRCLDGQTLRESWPLSQSLRPCLHSLLPVTNVLKSNILLHDCYSQIVIIIIVIIIKVWSHVLTCLFLRPTFLKSNIVLQTSHSHCMIAHYWQIKSWMIS